MRQQFFNTRLILLIAAIVTIFKNQLLESSKTTPTQNSKVNANISSHRELLTD